MSWLRVLFLVSDGGWSPSARAFLLAARGLDARGHDVMIACEPNCPMQIRAHAAQLAVVEMHADASAVGDAWQLRGELRNRAVDVVFAHTDDELLVASSALRLGRTNGGVLVRRVPPFVVPPDTRRARIATRLSSTSLMFSTEADRDLAVQARDPRALPAVAPLGIDLAEYDAVHSDESVRIALGAGPDSLLIVCVHDGGDRDRAFAAMRAVALLAPRHPELRLVILGAGRLDDLRMHGAALGINAMVTYLGERDDELSILRAADVGWIAADGDAAALAAMDFMAFRTPVLAERSPLTEHFVADGIAGALLSSNEPGTMAASVAAFLARKDARVQMGNAGRARLQREFPYSVMIRGYEQAMAAAVASHQPRRL